MRLSNCRAAFTAALLLATVAGAPSQLVAQGNEPTLVAHAISPRTPNATRNYFDTTIRNIVQIEASGSRVKVRLSNITGDDTITADRVWFGNVNPDGSYRGENQRVQMTFGGSGNPGFSLAPGTFVDSNTIDLPVTAGDKVAISIHYTRSSRFAGRKGGVFRASGYHAGDVDAGSFVVDTDGSTINTRITVTPRSAFRTLVCFGDSITEGFRASPYFSYPQQLSADFRRAEGANPTWDVVNAGISGNRVLTDGVDQAGVTRFSRDALLDAASVKAVLVLEGINDINNPRADGTRASAQEIINGLQRLINTAHDAGKRIYGGTILPAGFTASNVQDRESKRQVINDWIRNRANFNGVIDFDAVMRDPADARRLRPAYDSNDGLHPNDDGYAAMANAVRLTDIDN